MTGRDIDDLSGHPYIVDGNMTMYFESDTTRQAFIDMPVVLSVERARQRLQLGTPATRCQPGAGVSLQPVEAVRRNSLRTIP